MSRTSVWLLAVLLVLALLAGCAGSRPEYEYSGSKAVKIENIEKRALEGGFMEISITFRNRSSGSTNFTKYRVNWFDESGFLLEQTTWRPLRVQGGAAMYARERTTKPGVKDFTVIIATED